MTFRGLTPGGMTGRKLALSDKPDAGKTNDSQRGREGILLYSKYKHVRKVLPQRMTSPVLHPSFPFPFLRIHSRNKSASLSETELLFGVVFHHSLHTRSAWSIYDYLNADLLQTFKFE